MGVKKPNWLNELERASVKYGAKIISKKIKTN